MIIRTISFDPIRVTVNNVEAPVVEQGYMDEFGKPQKVIFVVVNGEKVPIQNRCEISTDLVALKLDQVLEKVEAKRIEKDREKTEEAQK